MSLDTTDSGGKIKSGGFGDAFYPLYQWLFEEEDQFRDFVNGVDRKLSEARMSQPVEMFLSRALAIGLLTGVLLALVGGLITVFITTLINLPEMTVFGLEAPKGYGWLADGAKFVLAMIFGGLFFGGIGFAMGFGALVSIPYFRASGRKREINVLLADSVSFMYALSVGGLNQLEILRAIARAEDTYGEVSREFRGIVLETEYFDTDYRTAIRNQAMETPSDELSQFLTDMLSIVNSGGDMTSFLEDQKDKYMRTAKQEQKQVLDTLELFGEMYMTLSLFPLLLIIILVIMQMMGQAQTSLLYGTVYGLIPLIGVGFLVLVSTITQDEIGDGYLRPENNDQLAAQIDSQSSVFSLGVIEDYTGDYGIFDRVESREGFEEAKEIIMHPFAFFRDNPTAVLALTVPISLVVMLVSVLSGSAPLSIEGMKSSPVKGTFVWLYLPLYINFLPLMIFYEWNIRSRRGVITNLSENLRKLSSANDTGMTLLESIKVVSDTSSGKLADEFEMIHAKVNYGTTLKSALREFNNKYHIPRLARTVKLISKAQEASSHIQDVLTTAAKASENQDDIDRERKARTRMQVVIIVMTYLTLLGVIALLKVQFLDVMAGLANQASGSGGGGAGAAGAGGGFGGNVDTGLLSMLFFHAVTLQAIMSAFIAGYIRNVDLMSGVKFAVILPTIALAVWTMVG